MHLRQRQRCTKGDENPLLAARRLEAFDTVGKPLPTGYQAGMPLALLTEWLGHADPETTLIYAHADTEMKRHALEKANSATGQSPLPAPLWHDREDIIQRLCGLKE
jgi:hypothetical protein